MTATGYLHPGYAASFATVGEPFELPRAGGRLLRRPIAAGPAHDLVGPYPLFLCHDLAAVPRDLADRADPSLASVVFVTDPFYDRSVESALTGFDLVRRFKSHQVARLEKPWRSRVSRSCRKYADRAGRELDIQRIDKPSAHATAFWDLYRELMERHHVEGVQRLSAAIVAAHLALPGVTLFAAGRAGSVLGFASFVEVEERVYGHLMAVSTEGRERFATYGLLAAAFEHYEGRFEWLDLGGNPGVADDPANGVYRFKQGWASETRPVYLCGKVLDRELYVSLCQEHAGTSPAYFPAYRATEAHPAGAR